MSPSPPYELVVGAIAAGVAATVLAIATMISSYFVLRRQLQVLAFLTQIRSDLGRQYDHLEGLDSRHVALVGDVARLEGDVAELRGVRAELRRHATSSILHPERSDVS